jgi:hypothetical protein
MMIQRFSVVGDAKRGIDAIKGSTKVIKPNQEPPVNDVHMPC